MASTSHEWAARLGRALLLASLVGTVQLVVAALMFIALTFRGTSVDRATWIALVAGGVSAVALFAALVASIRRADERASLCEFAREKRRDFHFAHMTAWQLDA